MSDERLVDFFSEDFGLNEALAYMTASKAHLDAALRETHAQAEAYNIHGAIGAIHHMNIQLRLTNDVYRQAETFMHEDGPQSNLEATVYLLYSDFEEINDETVAATMKVQAMTGAEHHDVDVVEWYYDQLHPGLSLHAAIKLIDSMNSRDEAYRDACVQTLAFMQQQLLNQRHTDPEKPPPASDDMANIKAALAHRSITERSAIEKIITTMASTFNPKLN